MNQTPGRVVIAIVVTFVIMLVVPFPVYSLFAGLGMAQLPEGGSPGEFFLSVVVMKIGVALGFVLLFNSRAEALVRHWWRYAVIWWLMSTVVEVGQAIGPGYSAGEAVAGSISEAIYFPLCSFFVAWLFRSVGSTASA